ncbi:Hypothetical predicted protein [Olea europaea subsp. europaea]|uniref:Prolamin-like domain-containing protein n=1 Tax=Olea europaea subsp. europaea TaxID=158383 RepID=A0A8S0UT71_OLEEU|nr:Hypothetical predicted protein [Olea europaea subsp. europaea]
MASKSSPAMGALSLLLMLLSIETIAVMAAKQKFSHFGIAPQPQLSPVGPGPDAMLTGERPCLAALIYVEGCKAEIFKTVFGVPLDNSCCQAVKQIAQNCLPKWFPLYKVFMPSTLENCIFAPA